MSARGVLLPTAAATPESSNDASVLVYVAVGVLIVQLLVMAARWEHRRQSGLGSRRGWDADDDSGWGWFGNDGDGDGGGDSGGGDSGGGDSGGGGGD